MKGIISPHAGYVYVFVPIFCINLNCGIVILPPSQPRHSRPSMAKIMIVSLFLVLVIDITQSKFSNYLSLSVLLHSSCLLTQATELECPLGNIPVDLDTVQELSKTVCLSVLHYSYSQLEAFQDMQNNYRRE